MTDPDLPKKKKIDLELTLALAPREYIPHLVIGMIVKFI